jgi:hypothetical protein
VFATGAAPEIIAGHQYGSTFKIGMVKFEGRIGFTIGGIAPVKKCIRSEPAALDRFQKLLGDDGIGVHIGPVQGGNNAGMGCKWFQCFFLLKVVILKNNELKLWYFINFIKTDRA